MSHTSPLSTHGATAAALPLSPPVVTPSSTDVLVCSDSSVNEHDHHRRTHHLKMSSKPIRKALSALSTRSSASSTTSSIGGHLLERIEYVEVNRKVKRYGQKHYVIEVYRYRDTTRQRMSDYVYSPTIASRFSEEQMHTIMKNEREPDYDVEHKFDEFLMLRRQLEQLLPTHMSECSHGEKMAAILAQPENHMWTLKHFFSTNKKRKHLLEKFVNSMVTCTSEMYICGVIELGHCRGCTLTAEMMEHFLKRKYEDSLGII